MSELDELKAKDLAERQSVTRIVKLMSKEYKTLLESILPQDRLYLNGALAIETKYMGTLIFRESNIVLE